jgi:ribosomal 50S subunit-associated protein YjgA (DUF615 family)
LLTGHLNQDDRLLAFGRQFQNLLTAQLARPPLDQLMAEQAEEEKRAAEEARQEKPPQHGASSGDQGGSNG